MSNSVRDMYVGITFQDNASRALNSIDRTMDDIETGIAGIGRRLDDTSDDFSSVGRVGVNALNRVEDGFDDAEREATAFNREVNRSEGSIDGLKKAALGIGGIIAGAFAVDKIKDFSVSAIEVAAGTQALNSQFEQVFTGIQDTATASLDDIAKQTGVLPNRLKSSFVQMAAFAKTTGVDTASALNLTERATIAAADSAAFLDRSIEDVTENLQSFLKGNFENDAALGISATETTRNAKANELYGTSFTKLSEAQKQLTLLAMVEDGNKLSGALGQAARESDGFENVIGNLKSAWDGFKGTLATPMLETVTTGIEGLTQKIQGIDAEELGIKFKNGFDKVMDVAVPTFEALKTGLGWVIDNKELLISAISGITAGFVAFKAIKTGMAIFDFFKNAGGMVSIFASLTNPVGLAVVAIGGLVAAGVYLYRNWDTVKEKAGQLWTKTKEVFGNIKTWVSDKLTEVKERSVEAIGLLVDLGKAKFADFKQGIIDDIVTMKDKVVWVFTEMPFVVAEKLGFMVGTAINWISQLPSKFGEYFGLAKDWAIQKISELPGLVSGFLTKTKDDAVIKLTGVASDFTTWFTTAKDNAVNIVTGLPGQIAGFVGQIPGAVAGKIASVYSKFKELGSSIPKAIGEGFESAFAALGKGVKWAFDKLVSGVTSLKSLGAGLASSFNDGVKSGMGGKTIDGSHATGLASVPYDSYTAELHQDEAVLTAKQSNALRSAGILSANSDGTPSLNLDTTKQNLGTELKEMPYDYAKDGIISTTSNSSPMEFNMPVEIIIQGNADSNSVAEIRQAFKQLEATFGTKVREVMEQYFKSRFEAQEG